jgi:hypothetical protein
MEVKIGQAKKIIKDLYRAMKAGVNVPPVLMISKPGEGKTSVGSQVAMEEKDGFISINSLVMNPVDFAGIPFPDSKKEYVRWLPPDIFPREDRDGKYGILMIDEITSAPGAVQVVCQRLVLERKIGDVVIPPGWMIIAAGNRMNDRAVVYQMPSPLTNRFMRFEVTSDIDDWKEWALAKGIHHFVVGFLSMRPGLLNDFDPAKYVGGAFPTPRSWERVSELCHAGLHTGDSFYTMVAGLIGDGAAAEFTGYIKIASEIPSLDDVLAKKVSLKNIDEPSILYAIAEALIDKVVKDHSLVKKFLEVVGDFPTAAFSVLCIKDAVNAGLKMEMAKHSAVLGKLAEKYKQYL